MPLPGVRHNDKERASGAINNQKPLGRGEKSTGRGGRGSATGSERFGGDYSVNPDCFLRTLPNDAQGKVCISQNQKERVVSYQLKYPWPLTKPRQRLN